MNSDFLMKANIRIQGAAVDPSASRNEGQPKDGWGGNPTKKAPWSKHRTLTYNQPVMSSTSSPGRRSRRG
jgi:hypothetical protein